MKKLLPLALSLHSGLLLASPALDAGQRQPLNLHAIGMFMVFVLFTLCITWWAARRTHSTADFYSAGGGIRGWQNGLALAGDYMSASTLLGITALIYSSGMDGYIYLIAFFAGWPVLLLLMTERLRNLGRFTFADITSGNLVIVMEYAGAAAPSAAGVAGLLLLPGPLAQDELLDLAGGGLGQFGKRHMPRCLEVRQALAAPADQIVTRGSG